MFPGALQHGRFAVGDDRGAAVFTGAEVSAGSAGNFIAQPKVAVTAALGQERPGRIDPRPGDDPLVDGAFESEGGTAGVADGGEAAQQHGFGVGGGGDVDVAFVGGECVLRGESGEHQMHVGVYQAGDEGFAGAVEHLL